MRPEATTPPDFAEFLMSTSPKFEIQTEERPKMKGVDKDMSADLGKVYGDLITFDQFVEYEDHVQFCTNGWSGRQRPIEYMETMLELGVAEILLSGEDGEMDTLYFRVDENTDLASLMVAIHNNDGPDEFSRCKNPAWFRIWWD